LSPNPAGGWIGLAREGKLKEILRPRAAGCWLLAAGWTAPQSGLLKPRRPAVGAAIVDSDFSPPGRFMLQSDVVIGKLTILENSPLLQQIFRLRFYFYLLSCNSLIINFKGC